MLKGLAVKRPVVIEVKGLYNRFGHQVIHNHISLKVYGGEILGIVGGSGSGKTVLMRSMVGLHKFNGGEVTILGRPLKENFDLLRDTDWGVLFQKGGLISSLNVADNISIPMREIARIPKSIQGELISLKLAMVGLPPETAFKYPAELSGGMIKRVALARALAIDPKLIFLDEPTAGLDPISAAKFDELILKLQKNLHLTIVIVTHDLDTLFRICTRVAVLVDQNVTTGTIKQLQRMPHPWIQEYFNGPRARAVHPGIGLSNREPS